MSTLTETETYDVVWPSGANVTGDTKLAPRLDDLNGKVVAELWDWIFKGDQMFLTWERELKKRYPDVKFVHWSEFGEIHGADEHEVLADLPRKLKEHGVDAAIVGVGCCGSCTPAVTRASVLVEKLGIPTVSMICSGFKLQGRLSAKALGMPNLPYTVHPGHVNTVSDEELDHNASTVMLDHIIEGLTVQPAEEEPEVEPAAKDVVYSGSFNEIQQWALDNEWSDGLPIIPPTHDRVEEFLKYTDRDPDEVIGTVLPANRQATVWNVAVNGVISGCRPEYMPVLLAVVEAMVDPLFRQEHLGQTPGTEALIVLNGKIVRDLGFNCTQGAFRPGFQANTSVGRFWRTYLRNVAGFLPHKTDKGCFGDNFRLVLAENEDAGAVLGWQPNSADLGFEAGTNLVTVMSVTERTTAIEVGMPTGEEILRNIELRMTDNKLFVQFFFRGMRTRPLVVLTPTIVEKLVEDGWTKEAVRQHFYENTKLSLRRIYGNDINRFTRGIDHGNWPDQLGTDKNLDREVQMVSSPDDFIIVVSGDPGRDHVIIGGQNGYIGYPTSREVKLPDNWDQLVPAAKTA